MARFNDVLNQYGDAENIPEDFISKLMEAYDEDLSVPIAKVGELETVKSTLETKVSELKSQNYDLLYAGGGTGNNATSSEDPGGEDPSDDDHVSIADLFEITRKEY